MRGAVAAALVLCTLALPGAQAALGIARFRETPITHVVHGFGAGHVEAWRTRVWLLHRQQPVGTGAIACIYVDTHTDVRECTGTYILPRGRIQVAGEIITRSAYQMTIVGGTGYYTGAHGVAIASGLPLLGVVTFYLD